MVRICVLRGRGGRSGPGRPLATATYPVTMTQPRVQSGLLVIRDQQLRVLGLAATLSVVFEFAGGLFFLVLLLKGRFR